MNIKKDIIWRVGLLYVCVFIFALLIVGKVLYLQFIDDEKWKAKATKITSKDYIIPANRGEICAEDGRILACSLPFYELRMDLVPPALTDDIFYKNIDGLASELAKHFEDNSETYYKDKLIRARKMKKRDLKLNNRWVSHDELKKISTFPILNRGRIKGGFKIGKKDKRVKPYNDLANRTIGYLYEGFTGRIAGRVGLEESYESQLKGKNGIKVKKLIAGRIRDLVQLEPRDGNDVITCINIDFQDIIQTTLYNQLEKFGAQYGCAILMETNTGAIKAIANLSYDKENENYQETFNFGLGETGEPGSVFKLASIIALLEDGYVDLNDTIDTGKGIKSFYDRKMYDSQKGGYGKITVKEVFEKSSNVGISTMVFDNYKNKPSRFIDRLYDLHLNEPVGINIKGEGQPKIKYPDDPTWSGVSLPWMSIGYEVQTTPLQILTLYNAVANDGKMLRPKLVKEIRYHGKTVRKIKKEDVIESRICSKETLKKLRSVLEGVVENGTAKSIRSPYYKIAGKTGTALIADRNLGYKNKIYQSSFVGYFPADNPKYSCIVVVVNPDKSKGYYGATVAAPVFKLIADKIYASGVFIEKKHEKVQIAETKPPSLNGKKEDLLCIFKKLGHKIIDNSNTEWVITSRKKNRLELLNREIKTEKVPNVKGMGLKDALFLLENAGLTVEVKGNGMVIKQSVKPGTEISEINRINIELN